MAKQLKILITDDDKNHRAMLGAILKEWGYDILNAQDGQEAVDFCRDGAPDIILMDARMPRLNGYEAFKRIHALAPDLPVIIMTAFSEVSDAVDAIRNGAWDYLTKPLDFEKLRVTLRNAAERVELARENAELCADLANSKQPLLGSSPAMLKLLRMIQAVAPSEATCLITGESGTGKELAARAVHLASKRAKGPFVAINCGALTESLLASELFGHEKGAFTGAARARDGLFSQANGGTIFLDEIGEMPPSMQVQLLRALQEREIIPVGASRAISIDCRVIAATNRDLASMAAEGKFREDLFYRLNVVNLALPPLRERTEDIPMLANHFGRRFSGQNGRSFSGFTPAAMRALLAWRWPGNVRELENVMERGIILMTGDVIGERELPEPMLEPENRYLRESRPADADNAESGEKMAEGGIPTLEEVERKVILETLRRMGNNKTETAKALGITRKTLHARLNRYQEKD